MTRVSFDTNVLVYAELEPDTPRGVQARTLILKASADGVMPVQVLGEFLRVVQRKAGERFDGAVSQVDRFAKLYATPETTTDTLVAAAELARLNRLQFFDAIIIAASVDSGAAVLLSEVMQDGRRVAGLRILNPFNPDNAAAIDALFPA